jgi:hypothetical protein
MARAGRYGDPAQQGIQGGADADRVSARGRGVRQELMLIPVPRSLHTLPSAPPSHSSDCPGQLGNHVISHSGPAMSPAQRQRPR